MKEFAQSARLLLDLKLSSAQLNALQTYEDLLIEWNAIHNLTTINHPDQIRTKHFLDSLSCLLVMRSSNTGKVIDIGTGAGFPGIPLKIILPDMHLTLVESVGKKAQFCRTVVAELQLTGVEILQRRAEDVGQDLRYRENYDWALARAVAGMGVLAEYLLPLLHIGGSMLAMKGESAPAETHTAEHAIHLLGGCLHKLIPVILPGVVEERYLVVIDKVAATPPNYPRRAGIPSKRPIS